MSSSSTSDSSDSSSCSSSSSSSDSESSIDEKKGVCLFSKSAGKGNALKPKAAPAPNKKRARDAETPSGVQPVKTAVPVASKSAAAAAPATETAEKSGKKNKGKSMGPRFSLFVGQLPFDATASSIEEFFTSKVKGE